MFLYRNIPRVFEIIGALLAGEEIEEFADLSPGCLDVAWLCGSDQVFDFGEDLLDRIEVGAVGRQEEQVSSPGADGVAGWLALVTAEVVEDDDLALCQGGCQYLLDVEGEEFAVDGAVDDPRRADPVVAQRRDEGHGFPMAEGRRGFETLPTRPPAAQRRHVGLDPGLIDKDQARSVNPALMGLPAYLFTGDIGALLLGWPDRFF